MIHEKWFLKNTPKNLKSLLKYISPSALKVIHWKTALKDLLFISKNFFLKKGIEKSKKTIEKELISPFTFEEKEPAKYLSLQKEKKSFGQNLLRLYFSQLFSQKRCFLDLRISRFTTYSDNTILWSPNNLIYSFDKSFQQDLCEMYRAFYENNNQLMLQSAKSLGLIKNNFNNKQTEQLISLLENHFGHGRNGEVKFSIEKFQSSFESLFDFLQKNDVKLSANFLFLGIYVLTLYMALEALDIPVSPNLAIQEFL